MGLTVVLILAGFYIPGSAGDDVATQLEDAHRREKPLEAEVANLRVYKQRRAELQSEMDALQKQLATLQTIVPEEKQTDQFILMVQARPEFGSFGSAPKAKPVATSPTTSRCRSKIEADGPYYSVLDFFSKLGRLRESSMWAT